ncbi:MAG: ATP-binding protein [Oscillospiraceae bacterium]|nr:ATP-binding protein [Oscillospiraceae bacterium]
MGEIGTMEFIYLFSGIVLCGLGIYWWLKKESVNTFNIKSQEQKNSEQQAEIEDLNAFCLELEKDRHTQNKKLPAYREAVEQAITGDKETKLKALNLLIAAQRVECEVGSIQTSSRPLIDAILHFNNMRCDKCGIKFESVGTKITSAIKESLLETLIANLLDNSMNSHENNSNQEKYITVHFNEDSLTVTDNGKPFKESVLADMSRCKETLTPNRGDGVGIGFVTIFEITNECSASVEVVQNNEKKSITVRFDGNNRLVIDNQYEEQEIKV